MFRPGVVFLPKTPQKKGARRNVKKKLESVNSNSESFRVTRATASTLVTRVTESIVDEKSSSNKSRDRDQQSVAFAVLAAVSVIRSVVTFWLFTVFYLG